MRVKALLYLAFFAIFLVPASAGSDRGFEGKWVLDEKRSSGTPMIDNLVQEIKQDGSDIKIVSTYREPKNGIAPILYLGIMQTEVKLSRDGSESVNYVGPYQQRGKTTIEGNRMVCEWVAGMKDGQPVSGQWVRELSPDGKEMTLHIKTSADNGRNDQATLVFKRK